MQKPRFMGCFWSSQGKKVPKRHFFEISGAKRNKLLVETRHSAFSKMDYVLKLLVPEAVPKPQVLEQQP
jgi:hypothetical protein